MKKILTLIFIPLILGCGFKYQRNHSNFTETEIEERAKTHFGYNFDFNNSLNEYLFDGTKISIDSVKLVLKNFKEKDYKKIDFEKRKCANSDLDLDCGIVLEIDTKLTQQNETKKKEILDRTKAEFDNGIGEVIIRDMHPCPECKLIFINYQPYEDRDALKVLNDIKIDEIEYIAEYDKPLNPEYFGSIGKTGWIQIWTK